MMAAQLSITCDVHEANECPDILIGYFSTTRDYGLRVHDGGSSMILIDFCPWCRSRLRPLSRGALVRSRRLTEEALQEDLQRLRRKQRGGPVPGRRIEV
jgi:hypothetical protein